MASEVTRDESLPVPQAQAEAPPRKQQARRVYAGRFLIVWAVLALAAIAGIDGLVVAVTRTHNAKHLSGPWSSWRPTGGGLGMDDQIAQYVGAEYRLSLANQLVDVIAKIPNVTSNNHRIPIGYIAVKGRNGRETNSLVTPSNSVMYTLCGLGQSCTIATGKPSVARGRLVRREILELALYTFRYQPAVHNVIAVMPPRTKKTTAVIVLLQRSDLAAELNVALNDTLSPHTPGIKTMTASDTAEVKAQTDQRVYSFSVTRAPDGNVILILSHVRAVPPPRVPPKTGDPYLSD